MFCCWTVESFRYRCRGKPLAVSATAEGTVIITTHLWRWFSEKRIMVKYNKEEKCDPCPCVILLLMAHFKEKSEGLILQADVTFSPQRIGCWALRVKWLWVHNRTLRLEWQRFSRAITSSIWCTKKRHQAHWNSSKDASLGSTQPLAQRWQSGSVQEVGRCMRRGTTVSAFMSLHFSKINGLWMALSPSQRKGQWHTVFHEQKWFQNKVSLYMLHMFDFLRYTCLTLLLQIWVTLSGYAALVLCSLSYVYFFYALACCLK